MESFSWKINKHNKTSCCRWTPQQKQNRNNRKIVSSKKLKEEIIVFSSYDIIDTL